MDILGHTRFFGDTLHITEWGRPLNLVVPAQVGAILRSVGAGNVGLRQDAAATSIWLDSAVWDDIYVHQIGIDVLWWIQSDFELAVFRFNLVVPSLSDSRL